MDARSRRSIRPHPWRDNERAWREHYRNGARSMRAVKGDLGHSLERDVKRSGRPSLGLMARLGVPVGGRVRKPRAVEIP